jgi:r-opsin
MIPQFFSANGFVLEGFQTHCSFDYLSQDLYSRSFMIIMILGGLLIPLFLIIFFYIRIWFIVSKQDENFMVKTKNKKNSSVFFINSNRKRSTKVTIVINDLKTEEKKPILNLNLDYENKKIISKQIRLLKSILIIIFLFCLAWFPYAIIVCIAQFSSDIENKITPFTTELPATFAKLSSVYNPFIFIITSERFKKFYVKFSKKIEESSIDSND